MKSQLQPWHLLLLILFFAKIPAERLLESPGLSLPSRRLSLNAKSNRTPGGEARPTRDWGSPSSGSAPGFHGPFLVDREGTAGIGGSSRRRSAFDATVERFRV